MRKGGSMEQDPLAPSLLLALPFLFSSLSPLPSLFPSPSFNGKNPLITSPSIPLHTPVSMGSGVSLTGKLFKSRWLRVKIDAFWGKI